MVINKLWKTRRKADFKYVLGCFLAVQGNFLGFPHTSVNIPVSLWITGFLDN
jgi:hypothetical protein